MELSPRYVLPPGATRRDDAILPFKALAQFFGQWNLSESGPARFEREYLLAVGTRV